MLDLGFCMLDGVGIILVLFWIWGWVGFGVVRVGCFWGGLVAFVVCLFGVGGFCGCCFAAFVFGFLLVWLLWFGVLDPFLG